MPSEAPFLQQRRRPAVSVIVAFGGPLLTLWHHRRCCGAWRSGSWPALLAASPIYCSTDSARFGSRCGLRSSSAPGLRHEARLAPRLGIRGHPDRDRHFLRLRPVANVYMVDLKVATEGSTAHYLILRRLIRPAPARRPNAIPRSAGTMHRSRRRPSEGRCAATTRAPVSCRCS